MTLIGSEILAKALKRQDVECFFYLMGGPMMAAETATMAEASAESTCGTNRPRR